MFSSSPVAAVEPQKRTNTRRELLCGADGKIDKNELVNQFSPFVKGIARQVRKSLPSRIELDDLVSYGMTGLLEAAERFDPKHGANFSTFSYYRVRGAIYDGLRGMGWVSRSEYQKIRFGEKATAYLENMAARRGSDDGAPRRSTEENLEELANQVSQLVTIYVTSIESLQETDFEDKYQERQDDRVLRGQMKNLVGNALLELPEQDKALIDLYYFKNLSLQEVGDQIGLSKSWTCRRHAQVIDKLSRILKKLLDGSVGDKKST